MKNKYVIRSRISEAKFRQIIKYFALDLQANQIAELTGLSRNSINGYIKAIRTAIVNHYDPSYSFEKPYGKQLLFGLCKHNATISVHHISYHDYKTIRDHIKESTIDISDEISLPYHGVIDFREKRHYSIVSKNNIIDTSFFWGYIKMRLMRFRGVSSDMIYLHLKECEFRYNNRNDDLYKLMLKLFRKAPLNL